MKLGARDISAFLAAPTQVGGTLIYGADRGQVRQHSATIAAKIVPDAQDVFNRTELSAETILEDPARLMDELGAMSLMGGRRLIVIPDAPEKLAAIIASCLEALHEGNYLIVTAEEQGPRSPLRALFESDARLAALPCYKDEGQSLSQLIQETLRKNSINANRDIIAYLCDNLGGDRHIILNELEKLALYAHGSTSLTLEEVRAVIQGSSEQTLDDVCQAVASGQVERLCLLWDRMAAEGIAEVMALRSVSRYFSRLAEAQSSIASGMSAAQAMKALRPAIFYKQEASFRNHLERWRPALLTAAQKRLVEAERDAKLGGDMATTICGQYLISIANAAR